MVTPLSRPKAPHPAGLRNKGNTCFFNASLQCMLSIQPFVAYFKETEFCKKKQPISYALRNFIFDYQNEKICDPRMLIASMSSKVELFDNKHQDAHQFLVEFLHALLEEQGKSGSTIENMFQVEVRDKVVCNKCSHVAVVNTKTLILYLFIEKSVQTSLDTFLCKEDTVDGDRPRRCPSCSLSLETKIGHEITSTSPFLIIHLCRFLSKRAKNEKPIRVDPIIKVNGERFENIGVVCHDGWLFSGHYIAKCNRNSSWYKFDDSSVSETAHEFGPSQPYILFYRKCDLQKQN